MNNKEEDWFDEVWRIKRKLSKEALKMGLKEYLDFAESESKKILATFATKKNNHIRVREKKEQNYNDR